MAHNNISKITLILIFLFTGCADMQVQEGKKRMEDRLNPLLGKTKEDVILSLGPPSKIEVIEGIEIYRYFQSFGTRSQAMVAPNPYLTSGSAKSWEAYNSTNVYFKENVMIKWDGYIQR